MNIETFNQSEKIITNTNLNDDNTIVSNGTSGNLNEVYQNWIIWNWLNIHRSLESIETQIFDCLDVKFTRRYVNIFNNKERIWTVSANTESPNTPLVLIHGFGGAIGLWIHNLCQLSQTRPLYAIDVLGFGRSSRPKFSDDAKEAEEEFVESIESWRKSLRIKKMIILGHSFGGFLSSCYALKYPQHTKALILADTWGYSVRNTNIQYRLIVKVAIKLAQYISPFSLLRGTGPIGLSLFKKARPDFRIKFIDILGNTDLIYEYIYHSNRQAPSGEYGFRAIADHVRYAKHPMINRITDLSPNIPIWFIYGSKSWIDKEAGNIVKENRNGIGFVSVEMINQAGHHVYADQPEHFNSHVQEILHSIDKL